MTTSHHAEPVELVGLLTEMGLSVATAESLTGGLVCAALVDVPGASAVVRGGVVAYTEDDKHRWLGVPQDLLARCGAVDPRVARAMAVGLRERWGVDLAIATTGNAGPRPSGQAPVGRVYVAVADHAGVTDVQRDLSGDRASVRQGTVRAALDLAVARLREQPRSAGGYSEGPADPRPT